MAAWPSGTLADVQRDRLRPKSWLALTLGAFALLSVALPAVAAPRKATPRWKAAIPPNYRAAMARWHKVEKDERPMLDGGGRPMLVLFSLNLGERVALRAQSDEGGFDALDLERASQLLRDQRTGLSHPVEPATLDLVYRAQRRFGAPELRVVSGYRAPKPGGRSNHGRGRAIDLVVPGARDEEVAKWARGLGFTGVGIYPNGGYVHLDVRPQSHFWIDRSGPGQRNREQALKGGEAQRADEQARRQHVKPVAPFVLPSGSIEHALTAHPPVDNHDQADDEDDAGD